MSLLMSKNKMNHSHMVAEYMAAFAHCYGVNKESAFALGLLHDIGYICGKENHAAKGFDIMSKDGYKLAYAIQLHGTSPRYCQDVVFKTERRLKFPAQLFLLWEADMHVNSYGKIVPFAERLRDIKNNYGGDSKEYTIAKDIINYVVANQYDYKINYTQHLIDERLMIILSDGFAHSTSDIQNLCSDLALYSVAQDFKSVVSSALSKLKKQGVCCQPGRGYWRIT